MLYFSLAFFLLSTCFAIVGFLTDVAFAGVSRALFYVFLIAYLISFMLGIEALPMRRRKPL